MGFIANWIGRLVDLKLDERGFEDQVLDPLSFDQRFRLIENEVQFKADTPELLRFYKTKRPINYKYSTHLFWRDVKGNIPIQHFPLANMITKAKTELVFHDEPIFSVLTKMGKPDKKGQKTLDDCFADDEIINVLRSASDMRSYSGGVAIVPTFDPEQSSHVIWVAYPRERCHPVFKRGLVDSVFCYDEYSDGEGEDKRDFILATEYGKGYIRYRLYKESKNKKEQEERPLTDCTETADLRDTYFAESGAQSNRKTFVYVKNGLDGISDYQNLIDDFSALDEAYSALTDLIRKGHIKTYIPKSQALKGSDGETYLSDDFSENVSMIPMVNPTNAPYKVERDLVALNDNESALVAAFDETLNHALLTTGLSPATLGIDSAGANSSALALNIRERVSMRTRAGAIGVWQKALVNLAELTMLFELGGGASENGEAYSMKIGPFAGQVSVQFPEYESPTFDEKVTSLSAALQAHLIDLGSALKELYPDKTDEEIENMRVMIEGGIGNTAEDINKENDKDDEDDGEDGGDDE